MINCNQYIYDKLNLKYVQVNDTMHTYMTNYKKKLVESFLVNCPQTIETMYSLQIHYMDVPNNECIQLDVFDNVKKFWMCIKSFLTVIDRCSRHFMLLLIFTKYSQRYFLDFLLCSSTTTSRRSLCQSADLETVIVYLIITFIVDVFFKITINIIIVVTTITIIIFTVFL